MLAGFAISGVAHAKTTLGFTVYKYDDNFMSVVRQAIESEAATDSDVRLLMNDSQNNQSMQNDQIDVLLARGVKASPLTSSIRLPLQW
ncbi:galactose/methyl galactoside ABC transport system D-galactose-binding periplasmic protein MglB [Vibrio astriarenae]|nr:galactose/methyl galactoside ABC transport system D-galactose-binding periplasmic protein MglB [Vibrio sp. C7]